MTTPGVCGAAILALTVTFVADAAAAQTRDFLRAPRVQSRVRLQWDQDARRVVAAPDDDLALQPLTSAPPFLTDAVVTITYPRLNPLRVEAVAAVGDAIAPPDTVTIRLRALLSLGTVAVPTARSAGDQESLRAFASPPDSCPQLKAVRSDAEALMSALFVSSRAITVAALLSSWRQAIDDAFAEGRDGAAAVSLAVAMITEFLAALDAQLGEGERIVSRIDAEVKDAVPSQSCEVSARTLYEMLALANPRGRLLQLRAVRVAAASLRDVLSRNYVMDGAARWRGPEYRLAGEIRPMRDAPVRVAIRVTHLRVDVDDASGAVTAVQESRGDETLVIQRASRFAMEFAVATVLGSVTRPGYGTTSTAGLTVVGRLPRPFASVEPAFLAGFVCRCRTGPLVAPMLQVGITTSKDVPALLAGGGVRLFGLPKGDIALGGGGMFAWTKDLRTLRVGDAVGGTIDIESDLHYVRRQGYYLALQYKF